MLVGFPYYDCPRHKAKDPRSGSASHGMGVSGVLCGRACGLSQNGTRVPRRIILWYVRLKIVYVVESRK